MPGTLYGMSDSGWLDQELFFNWFANHFLKHAVSARPLLLMLDGHSSHYTLELVQEALKNEVIVFVSHPILLLTASHWILLVLPHLKCRDTYSKILARLYQNFNSQNYLHLHGPKD